MAYDEDLADRIRLIMGGMPGVTERKMFGGIAFMVNGNMAGGPVNDVLIVRVGPAEYNNALTQLEANEMTFTGKPMKGMVEIGIEALDDDHILEEWMQRGIDYALSLPPK